MSKSTTYVGFRLPNDEHEKFTAKANKANMELTEFLREAILKNKTIIVKKEERSVDKQKLIFLYKKTSNNLNQLAKQIHTSNRAGTLSREKMNHAIASIENIMKLLEQGINDVN
ncbi:plasmid mobilization protein [Aliivibrio fischeri]|nr:plasmid mobilization relaxosome protein MobC [Aliivibrio fischeri]